MSVTAAREPQTGGTCPVLMLITRCASRVHTKRRETNVAATGRVAHAGDAARPSSGSRDPSRALAGAGASMVKDEHVLGEPFVLARLLQALQRADRGTLGSLLPNSASAAAASARRPANDQCRRAASRGVPGTGGLLRSFPRGHVGTAFAFRADRSRRVFVASRALTVWGLWLRARRAHQPPRTARVPIAALVRKSPLSLPELSASRGWPPWRRRPSSWITRRATKLCARGGGGGGLPQRQ